MNRKKINFLLSPESINEKPFSGDSEPHRNCSAEEKIKAFGNFKGIENCIFSDDNTQTST
jgi:hypothetical protein